MGCEQVASYDSQVGIVASVSKREQEEKWVKCSVFGGHVAGQCGVRWMNGLEKRTKMELPEVAGRENEFVVRY